MHDDVIICGNFIRDVFEITKVQTKTNISQHLGKFACCCKDFFGFDDVINVFVTSQPQKIYF